MTPLDRQQCVSLAPGVRWQIDRATGEAVLLYPEGILMLNETARELVARCDGKTTIAEIVVALAAEYEVSASELENDIGECLGDLQGKKLIVFAP
jgi:pyrroloquinoline quinone biosynthesis protein D